ncbi:MAG: transglutaminase domain-containing protein, partial [Bacteroidota bacterium]
MLKYVCGLILGLLIWFPHATGQHKDWTIAPTPKWVENIPYELDTSLFHHENWVTFHRELQDNSETGEVFARQLLYVRHPSQIMKQYSVSPEWQKPVIHKIILHRDGEAINYLPQTRIRYTYENSEINSESYSSQAEFALHFSHLKAGDVVEYSVSFVGKQPDLLGYTTERHSFSDYTYLYGDSIARFRPHQHYRFVFSNKRKFRHRVLNDIMDFKTGVSGRFSTWHWSIPAAYRITARAPKPPSWYFSEPSIFITEFDNFAEMNEKVESRLYQLSEKTPAIVQQTAEDIIQGIPDTMDQVSAIIDYVQNDIEYLAYGLIEPKSPESVIRQGFGDCKAKTQLTCLMLRCLNVEAWPVFVKADGFAPQIADFPGFFSFDHVIVGIWFQDEIHYVDVTASEQAGPLAAREANGLKQGMPLIKGQITPIHMPNEPHWRVEVTDTLSRMDDAPASGKIMQFYGELATLLRYVHEKREIQDFVAVVRRLGFIPFGFRAEKTPKDYVYKKFDFTYKDFPDENRIELILDRPYNYSHWRNDWSGETVNWSSLGIGEFF